MKLNNKGWGTGEMILLSCGLLVALLVAVFFISQLFKGFDKEMENNYFELETDLAAAGEKYIKNNNINVEVNYIIDSETLRTNGYIQDLKDKDGNLCTGYVNIYNNNYTLEYKGYIRCNNYETNGYGK